MQINPLGVILRQHFNGHWKERTNRNNRMKLKMESKRNLLICLAVLVVATIAAIEASENNRKETTETGLQQNGTAKVDKSSLNKKKIQLAKTSDLVKSRSARSIAAFMGGDDSLPTWTGRKNAGKQQEGGGAKDPLMTAAHEKKYKLVKKKPKHKKIKMEVFEPKMKYKKIKMKIPVKKMKKKKVKGYLVKKEHEHGHY